MADEKALPPGDNQDQGAPDETLEVKAPVPVGGGQIAKSPDETQSTVLQDPTRRRDTNTASLKRLRPEDFNQASADDDSDNTETVNIKVIKEQKKQFRNMMTSSQTLAVDSDGAPADSPTPAETQPSSKSTLKIKAPQAETRTESIPRPSAQSAAPTQPASPSPKSTLKIKAPPGVAPAQGAAKPGATLKIKAPAAAPAPGGGAASPAAQTVKQAAPGRPGKTIKLTQQPPSSRQQPARRASGAAEQYAAAPEVSSSPGIVYTIFSVGGIAACGVVLFKIFTSMNELFGSLNIFEKTIY